MGNQATKEPHQIPVLTQLVNSIIDYNDHFKNSRYNFLTTKVCDNYKMVIKEQLEKTELSIYDDIAKQTFIFIPNNHPENLGKKQEICETLSNHYVKTLQTLCLLKYVYNIEEKGDMSVAGIMLRNIRKTEKLYEINYCNSTQRDYTKDNSESIDFAKLAGFEYFVTNILTPTESDRFINVFKAVLQRDYDIHTFCMNDEKILFDYLGTDYGWKKKQKCRQGGGNYRFKVAPKNGVFHRDLCFDTKYITVHVDSKEGKSLLKLIESMQKHYYNNIDLIIKCIEMIVYKDSVGTGFLLRDITMEKLTSIVEEVKNIVKKFYIQSVIDYQNIIDCVDKPGALEKAAR
jgi:hypothetical protein